MIMNERHGRVPKILSVSGKKIRLSPVKHARTFWDRFKGLMGVSPHEHDFALVFHMHAEDRVGASIHMLFMQMPIDVLWLNEKKQVVDFATLKPWVWNYTPQKPAKYVIELPAHSFNGNVKNGMSVDWS